MSSHTVLALMEFEDASVDRNAFGPAIDEGSLIAADRFLFENGAERRHLLEKRIVWLDGTALRKHFRSRLRFADGRSLDDLMEAQATFKDRIKQERRRAQAVEKMRSYRLSASRKRPHRWAPDELGDRGTTGGRTGEFMATRRLATSQPDQEALAAMRIAERIDALVDDELCTAISEYRILRSGPHGLGRALLWKDERAKPGETKYLFSGDLEHLGFGGDNPELIKKRRRGYAAEDEPYVSLALKLLRSGEARNCHIATDLAVPDPGILAGGGTIDSKKTRIYKAVSRLAKMEGF